jgi:hypothetical protein
MSDNLDTFRISSSTILENDEDLIVYLYYDGNVAKLSLTGKTELERMINREIQAISDARIPSRAESFLTIPSSKEARSRVFVEENNDLSKIYWIHWSEKN